MTSVKPRFSSRGLVFLDLLSAICSIAGQSFLGCSFSILSFFRLFIGLPAMCLTNADDLTSVLPFYHSTIPIAILLSVVTRSSQGKVTLFIVSYFLADDVMLEEAAMGLPVRIHFRGFYSRSSSAVSAEVRMRKGRWTGEGGKPVTSLKWGGRGKSFGPREVTA